MVIPYKKYTQERRTLMFRVWGKIFQNNRLRNDVVIEIHNTELTRTKKITTALSDICYHFDLSIPIWLDSNIADIKRSGKTRFYQDSFIETISFDYLEFQIIEES